MAGLRGCVSYFTLPSAGAPAQKPSLMEGPPCYDSKHVLKTGRDSDNEILALLIAAIFLSAPALAETAQFAAAAKAAKVSSKVKNSARAYAPTRRITNAERGAALVGPNAWGLVATRPIVPR